jgi:hypothetical protein
VGLIAEAHGDRRGARGHAVEQKRARQVDPSARQVLVRADPELPAEHPHQVGGMGVDRLRRLPERHLLAEPRVDQLAQLVRDVGRGRRGFGLRRVAQVMLEPFGDKGEAAFRFEFPAGLVERVMQLIDALPEQGVEQHGLIHGPADKVRGKVREI